MTSGDQRRLTGSGSASEACSRRCAIQIHRHFTLLYSGSFREVRVMEYSPKHCRRHCRLWQRRQEADHPGWPPPTSVRRPNTAPDTSQLRPAGARRLLRQVAQCPGSSEDIPWIVRGHLLEHPGTSEGILWIVRGHPLGHPRTSMDRPRTSPGSSEDIPWIVRGHPLERPGASEDIPCIVRGHRLGHPLDRPRTPPGSSPVIRQKESQAKDDGYCQK